MSRSFFTPLALTLGATLLMCAGACTKKDPSAAAPGIGQQAAINGQPVTTVPSSSTPRTPPTTTRKRLVFLGDSLTAGYGLAAADSFPSRLEARLAKEGLSFDVVNAGVSGDTSAGGLRRLDWLFRGPKVDVLFVCLGANDGMRGLPVAAMEANLRAIVTKAKEKGAEVVLAGMAIPLNYGAAYRASFEETFPRLAKELGVPFVPFLLKGVAGDPKQNLGDGIHPNARGYEVIAQTVYEAIAPILKKVAGSR